MTPDWARLLSTINNPMRDGQGKTNEIGASIEKEPVNENCQLKIRSEVLSLFYYYNYDYIWLCLMVHESEVGIRRGRGNHGANKF